MSSTKEAMDLGGSSGSRRRGSAPKAGSVWETRMKLDQVKGGFKVFNETPDLENNNTTTVNNPEIQMDNKKTENARAKQSPTSVGVSGKRKTWKSDNSEGSPVQIARKRSDSTKNSDESSKELTFSGDGVVGIKKTPVLIKKTRSSAEIELRKVKSEPSDGESKAETAVGDGMPADKNPIGGIGEKKTLTLIGVKKSRSDEEFGVCEEKSITSDVGPAKIPPSDDYIDDDEDEDMEIEVEKKSLDIKEIKVQVQNLKKHSPPPPVNHTKTIPTADHFHGVSRTNSKLQSFVDLVMWRDASKSAFVFGVGTFAIVSSSYTKDLNISFISVISYLGLVYLAAIFLFRSLINRGSLEMNNAKNKDFVVGEEEAIWAVKLFLPYLNEFLLKLRALFSGDPSTTMKLAVLLFILARCGSSITVWKMAKLGFIGVFTVPKICSTYSSQLTAYGTFWIRRFRDAWESCSHKKAVGFALFTLVWNLSSVVARIWAVFMLFVAFKYYQQSLMTREEWADEETISSEKSSLQGHNIGARSRSTLTRLKSQKKVY
ncbi:hypothetical protein ABFS82_11G034400 [Erythranthe guttata]|uniref:reticulon-like protein B21 isoform X1 n=1 Tax=Erythranthe guttata TaxID=4155 RepID=UPI00064D966F|nr:PREDICTED: reticulon-like protein B21 isoform X1 [Erythranthe guttata]|eukprot:XP_012841124.1 PREDICTED: reticulon-like protein B21 isoform X1 [Erythranthe guttata]